MAQCYVQSFGVEAGPFRLYWVEGIPADPLDQLHNLWQGD